MGQPHGKPIEDSQLPSAIRAPRGVDGGGGQITRAGVVSTLGKIHKNIQKTIQNKKFMDAFSPNYNSIQKGLGK